MLRVHRTVAVLMAGLVAASALAGCTSWLDGGGGTKAGGAPVAVTLRLDTIESGSPPYRFFVEEFARQVEKRSGGGIHVDVHWEAIPWSRTSEPALADLVAAGGVDLALLPDRSFARSGASALDALHTPFLVDSLALADAIAEGDIGATMLDHLPFAGAVGLALAPEGVRHPAGYRRALTSPADFEDLRLRVPLGDPDAAGEWTMLRALGAQPLTVDVASGGLLDGSIDAVETQYASGEDFPPGMIYTANLGFFTKFDVLVATHPALDRLPAGGEELLRQSAATARDAAAAQRPTEDARLSALCVRGDDGVLASPEELAAFTVRAAPVIAQLHDETAAAPSIRAIEGLKAAMPAAETVIPEVCGPPTGDAARP